MSTAFDPQSKDQKTDLPVREGQGKESSIRTDNGVEKNGDSDNYPLPGTMEKHNKVQDEYDNKAKEKENETV